MNENENYILKKHHSFNGRPGPALLIIMDGVGIGRQADMEHQKPVFQ